MAIAATDLERRLSGGAANTSAAAALGGAMSTAAGGVVTDNVKNNIWPDVTGTESLNGVTRYRGSYWKNNHGTLALQSPAVYVSALTPSTSTEVDIGLAAEAQSTAMATIANETTAPASVTFSRPTSRATGLAPGNLAAGAYKGLWEKLVVTSSAAAYTGDFASIKLEGDTAA